MRLVHRITIAMLTTVMLVVALVAVSLYISVERGFSRYVKSIERNRLAIGVQRITEIYQRDHSWQALRDEPRLLARLLRPEDDQPDERVSDGPPFRPDQPGPPPPFWQRPPRPEQDPHLQAAPGFAPPPLGAHGPHGPHGPHSGGPDGDPLDLRHRVSLYDANEERIVGTGSFSTDAVKLAVVSDQRTVGWLGVQEIPQISSEVDLRYLKEVRTHIAGVAVSAIALGLLAGWLLTRRILRPIEALREGTKRLTAGDYEARLGLNEQDELGQLARHFDTLASTLSDDERSRRQWVADTSHELRTPITILRAELEAIADGIRPMNEASVQSLHTEVTRLGKLVDDLGELARSDRGVLTVKRTPVAVLDLLRESVAAFETRFAQQNISTELNFGDEDPLILGDALRLGQIFANLLENSLRYTNKGGQLRITSVCTEAQVTLRFEDSLPGVPPESLPRLFERFYRVDPSRSREHGGSGLGLSICLRLVQAHKATIHAETSPLGGLLIELNFCRWIEALP